MDVDNRAWLEQRAEQSAHMARETGKTVQVCVLADQGRGEVARAITLCSARRASHLGADSHITLVSHYDTTMTKHDMAFSAALAGVVDDYIECPTPGGQRLDRGILIQALAPYFHETWDCIPYAPVVYSSGARADKTRLGPWQILYDGHPLDNWRLKYVGMPWWELMSRVTGMDVRWDSLSVAAPLESAPWPEADEIPPGGSLAELQANSGLDALETPIAEGKKYAVVHNGVGGRSANKLIPKPAMDAIIKRLESIGLDCVQVGIRGEMTLPVWKHAGNLRLAATNDLIRRAVCFVGPEGFLPYMCAGLGKPAAVLFGPTPGVVYGFPGNLNILPGLSKWDKKVKHMAGKPRRCMLGTCFWGGGWTMGECWGEQCRAGQVNPDMPWCMNFPLPADAADAVGRWAEGLLYGQPLPKETVA